MEKPFVPVVHGALTIWNGIGLLKKANVMRFYLDIDNRAGKLRPHTRMLWLNLSDDRLNFNKDIYQEAPG